MTTLTVPPTGDVDWKRIRGDDEAFRRYLRTLGYPPAAIDRAVHRSAIEAPSAAAKAAARELIAVRADDTQNLEPLWEPYQIQRAVRDVGAPAVLAALTARPATLDELAAPDTPNRRLFGLAVDLLELRGEIAADAGGRYQRTHTRTNGARR
ncbi:hypothetical protein G419_16940 [Rhodococcus triatomae BKS 15-14]|nr:hypothetical protein G419_16940 [Rhodococcus triatomae BKS 15-14]